VPCSITGPATCCATSKDSFSSLGVGRLIGAGLRTRGPRVFGALPCCSVASVPLALPLVKTAKLGLHCTKLHALAPNSISSHLSTLLCFGTARTPCLYVQLWIHRSCAVHRHTHTHNHDTPSQDSPAAGCCFKSPHVKSPHVSALTDRYLVPALRVFLICTYQPWSILHTPSCLLHTSVTASPFCFFYFP
jgi:hypothetical protein